MENRREPIQVLLYNTETDDIPEIINRLTNRHNTTVEEIPECEDLDAIDQKQSVLVPYCSDRSCFSDIVTEVPEGIPILGLADDRSIAEKMIEDGFYDYFLLDGDVTEADLKTLYNRLQTLERSFSRSAEEGEIDTSELAEFAPDAFVVLNEDMSVRYMNRYSQVLNDDESDLETGEDVIEYVHPDDRERIKSRFQYLLDNPREIVRTECRVRSEEGDWVWVESSGQNLIGYKSVDGVFFVVRDINDRKKKEKEIERNRDRLDNVISIMSHDLRNLLNVGMARSEMIAEEYDDENAEAVNDSLDRMAELISDSLDIARTGRKVQEFESVNLQRLVKNCAGNTVPKSTVVHCEDQLIVEGDKSRLSNLLENLFNNSVEHNDSSVNIRVGMVENGFYVEDTGDGIDDENRDKVFESGFSNGRGSGLGLNIVKQVANAHEWDVEVMESEEGGARFEFTGVDVTEVV